MWKHVLLLLALCTPSFSASIPGQETDPPYETNQDANMLPYKGLKAWHRITRESDGKAIGYAWEKHGFDTYKNQACLKSIQVLRTDAGHFAGLAPAGVIEISYLLYYDYKIQRTLYEKSTVLWGALSVITETFYDGKEARVLSDENGKKTEKIFLTDGLPITTFTVFELMHIEKKTGYQRTKTFFDLVAGKPAEERLRVIGKEPFFAAGQSVTSYLVEIRDSQTNELRSRYTLDEHGNGLVTELELFGTKVKARLAPKDDALAALTGPQ